MLLSRGQLVKSLAIVLLGAILTIAVAWGLAAWGPQTVWGVIQDPIGKKWPRPVPEDWLAPVGGEIASNFGVDSETTGSVTNSGEPEQIHYWQTLFRYGWPCRALELEQRETAEGLTYAYVRTEHFLAAAPVPGILQLPKRVHQLLPLRPLWPGFVVNALLYSSVLWLIFIAPFALRRHRRIKRRLCVKCAYPIGTSPICTECGAPVMRATGQ